MAEQAATREPLAMLRVMGVVGSPALRSAATAAAAARGVGEQRWVAKIGNPSIGDCWVYRDDVGCQESVAVSLGYGRRRHAVVVLIDHVLGGGTKDSHVTGDAPRLLAQTRAGPRGRVHAHRDARPGGRPDPGWSVRWPQGMPAAAKPDRGRCAHPGAAAGAGRGASGVGRLPLDPAASVAAPQGRDGDGPDPLAQRECVSPACTTRPRLNCSPSRSRSIARCRPSR